MNIYSIVVYKNLDKFINEDMGQYDHSKDDSKSLMYDIQPDKFSIYSICNGLGINKDCNFLKARGVKFDIMDISDSVLQNKNIKIKKDIVDTKHVDEFQIALDKFIAENLTVDIILDKISESGMESLTKIEKDFLAKASQ